MVEKEWGEGLIRSWNDAGWVDLPARCATLLAPWLGAASPESVAVTDSISVNLAKLVGAALQLRPERRTVLTVTDGFPTDAYVATSMVDLLNSTRLERRESRHRVRAVPVEELLDRLDHDVAVLSIPHVDFATGLRLDVPRLVEAAHEVGALVLVDAAHSAGALALAFDEWDVDLAVGCSYKFLNAGPGGPSWLYVHPRWHDVLRTPIAGWFGHATPFAFDATWEPAPGARRFLAGTPSVLAFAAFEEALLAIADVSPTVVEDVAATLTSSFLALVADRLPDDVSVVTPTSPEQRGAQVTLRLAHAWEVNAALLDRAVIGDHRPPDLLRFGFAPLVTSPETVRRGARELLDVLDSEAWRDPRYAHRTVVP